MHEVVDNATMGESITCTIKPKLGYELDSVIVTDVKGAKLEFHDYTFTMPRSDVTIEVNFKPIIVVNPETKDIIKIALVLLIIAFIFIL